MKRILGLALVLSLGACLNAENNDPPQMPPGSVVFTFEPTALSYVFIDSTVNPALRLDWLVPPANQYVGTHCLGLLPSSPSDTSQGTFTFSWSGSNTGPVQRSNSIDTDTVVGYLLGEVGALATTGTYSIDGSNVLTLSWGSGTPARFFHPSSTIRLAADSIISDAELMFSGDSVREIWHVAWIFSGGTGC